MRGAIGFSAIAVVLMIIGFGQSWSVALVIVNLCLISAVMSLGVNIQWGYAGLFNVGIMAFAAIGGLAAILVSQPPVQDAVVAGGPGILLAIVIVCLTLGLIWVVLRFLDRGRLRNFAVTAVAIIGFLVTGAVFDPAVEAIEAVNPAGTGYLGGLGLPILLSWIVGGMFAAAAAYFVGRVALGLRSDYFAIATLGISEIVISVLKNEEWLTRGVKNVTGLPRPVPYELDLQQAAWFQDAVRSLNSATLSALEEGARNEALRNLVIESASLFVKLCYTGLFAAVLLVILLLSERALRSPWGRMMRAIRDNEEAAEALGKDVVYRHRQVFILGCAVVGIAGAMLVTLDGQFTPGSYIPLRFTFLIWVMVIIAAQVTILALYSEDSWSGWPGSRPNQLVSGS